MGKLCIDVLPLPGGKAVTPNAQGELTWSPLFNSPTCVSRLCVCARWSHYLESPSALCHLPPPLSIRAPRLLSPPEGRADWGTAVRGVGRGTHLKQQGHRIQNEKPGASFHRTLGKFTLQSLNLPIYKIGTIIPRSQVIGRIK